MITDLSTQLNDLMRNIYKQKGEVFAEIMVNWPTIIGANNSKNCSPANILKYNNNKTLVINVNNAATSLKLSYQEEIIIERIASYFGFKAIDKIKFKIKAVTQ